jgi:hypothetical protein
MRRERRNLVIVAILAACLAVLLAWCRAPTTPDPPRRIAPRSAPAAASAQAPAAVPEAPAAAPVAPEPVVEPPAAPDGPKRPRSGAQDDPSWLRELLEGAVLAVDPQADVAALQLQCAPDFTRCRMRAPLLDDALDEDELWRIARETVLEAAGDEAALTRAITIDPPDEAPLMELEITLVID